MKYHICHRCGCTRFTATATITQNWKLDTNGDFIGIASDCENIIKRPDENDLWTCSFCGTVTEGETTAHVAEQVHTVPAYAKPLKEILQNPNKQEAETDLHVFKRVNLANILCKTAIETAVMQAIQDDPTTNPEPDINSLLSIFGAARINFILAATILSQHYGDHPVMPSGITKWAKRFPVAESDAELGLIRSYTLNLEPKQFLHVFYAFQNAIHKGGENTASPD